MFTGKKKEKGNLERQVGIKQSRLEKLHESRQVAIANHMSFRKSASE